MEKITEFIYDFWRWHPEVALRYLPIKEEIEKVGGESILEIGSGDLGIAPYLHREVIGLDSFFINYHYPRLIKLMGEAIHLPFADKSFEVVVCTDVLEHLPSALRRQAIKEALRVASNLLILAFPTGIEAKRHDREMYSLYQDFRKNLHRSRFRERSSGKEEGFFQEHLRFGLPELKDVLEIIELNLERSQRRGKIQLKGNENINLRKLLMRGWMTENLLVDIVFRKLFLLFIPIFRIIDKEPYYRTIISVNL